MTIRRQTGYVLLGFLGLAIVGIILGIIFASILSSGGPSPPPEAAPPPTTASATPSPPPTTAPASSAPSPQVQQLPQGIATQVPFPDGTQTNGYTAGVLTYDFNAPAYAVWVHTAEVNKHWGFTYNYQCDPPTDDAWRHAYPGRGSFGIRFNGVYLLRGTAYNGSGTVTVHSHSGPSTHLLYISGPCTYELDYFYYPN